MTYATEKITRTLARLNPRSPQNPGKPAKRKKAKRAASDQPETELARRVRIAYEIAPTLPEAKRAFLRPFAGPLHPARCGATQTQSRSLKLDGGETDLDLAGALAAVKNPLAFQLVVFVALPGWQLDLESLLRWLRQLVIEEAMHNDRWPEIARPSKALSAEDIALLDPEGELDLHVGETVYTIDTGLLDRLVPAVLADLIRADACPHCAMNNGKVLDMTAKPPQWITCLACGGTTRTRLGAKKRAAALRVRYATFRTSDARWAYEWLLARCNSMLNGAAARIARARREG
jgi:hypothetical protein